MVDVVSQSAGIPNVLIVNEEVANKSLSGTSTKSTTVLHQRHGALREPLMTSNIRPLLAGAESELKKKITSSPKSAMVRLLDVHLDRSGTMKKKKLIVLRRVPTEGPDG